MANTLQFFMDAQTLVYLQPARNVDHASCIVQHQYEFDAPASSAPLVLFSSSASSDTGVKDMERMVIFIILAWLNCPSIYTTTVGNDEGHG